MLAGNTAPWLFNRTQYANGLGSTSSTTQLHADSNGNLVATVASEGGTAKADSLLLYGAYGSVDSEASGNAGTGIRSNGHSFGSYYADPETGLLYARARYYDPASGQFISRDPVEGEARLPITWGAYQYGRYNPYRYVDPNGEQSTSTLIDNAAEGCGRFTCALYALGKGLYVASTLGFASVHDPMRDAYDEGKISQGQYWGAGVGGGLAVAGLNVAGLNVATGAAGGALVGAASSTAGRVAVAAVVGASSGAAGDAATQAAHMGGGIQSGYDLQQTATSAGVGGALGAGSVPLANAIKSSLDRRTVARALAKELQTTEPVLSAKTPTIEAAKVRPEVSDTTPTLVAEGPRLRATGEGQSATRTARAVPSEGPCCFAPGTLVSTEEGDRPIETIQVGDRVWTRMEDGSGEAFLAPVTATHIRDDRPILRLTVEQVALPGEETAQTRTEDLLVTPGHPFYVSGRGFVSVEELQVGDELVSLAKQTRLRMRALRLESPKGTTYNLTVEMGHTFFVGGWGPGCITWGRAILV